MNLKFRLILLSFFQFFIWGSWLLTIGAYWFQNKQWSGTEFGAIFSTMGIAALFMPTLTGIWADRWIQAQKLLGLFHCASACLFFCLPEIDQPSGFFWMMLAAMCFYMPTISLANAVSFSALKLKGINVVEVFPSIRVWGTVGFVAATWFVSLLHLETSSGQFYIAGTDSLLLGVYAFTLPRCPTNSDSGQQQSFLEFKFLTAFKDAGLRVFFFFAVLLGAALQLTNAYGDTFIHDFGKNEMYRDTFAVKYPAVIMSLSQISETVFILTRPFMLRRFGIRNVMLFSIVAWVFRFGLLAYANPVSGLWMILLSCIIYGIAFDFYNISGSLFVETQTDSTIRASAQGLYMMMTNGLGALLGSLVSGVVIDRWFTNPDQSKNWQGIWLSFAGYALGVLVLFFIFFRDAKLKEPVAKNS
jgi:NHS family xanthosine MFS transporter